MESRLLKLGFAAVFLFALSFLSFTPRSEFDLLLIAVFFSFASWYGLLRSNLRIFTLVVLAVLGRLVFFKNLPMLSDDFYRFIWDGNLLLHGVNPIGKIPIDTSLDSPSANLLLTEMNSPDYPSIYPPLHQLGMAFGALFGSPESRVNGMRLFIITVELIGLLYFLRSSRSRLSIYLFYLLNPLVIVEGVGNVHFEAALLPFLAIGIDRAERAKPVGAGLAVGMAILTKLNPLIVVPAMAKSFSKRRSLIFVLSITAIFTLAFIPFMSGLSDTFSGFDLYFRRFEFNASLYYIFSEAGQFFLGYNPIAFLGPMMGLLSAVGILIIAFRNIPLGEKALLSYLVFFFFSTTVHPWYLIPFVFLALYCDRKVLLIWSFTAFFSYSHYLDQLEPKYPWIIAEYVSLLAAMIYSYRTAPNQLLRG